MNGLRMHNSEFERRVQQKTEGLKITPSQGLWDKIEGQLPPEKKRRRALLWILALLLVSAGAGWWFAANNQSTAIDNPPSTASTIQSAISDKPVSREDSNHTAIAANQSLSDIAIKDAALPPLPVQQDHNVPVTSLQPDSNQSLVQVTTKMSVTSNVSMRTESSKIGTTAPHGEDNMQANQKSAPSPKGKTAGQVSTIITAADIAMEPLLDSNAEAFVLPKLPMPMAALINVTTRGIAQRQLAQRFFIGPIDALNNRVGKKGAKKDWTIGFTAGLGLSKRNDKLFSSGDEKILEMVSNGGIITGGVFDTSKNNTINTYKPGLSFHIGVYAQRSISERWHLQTGLVYSYLSNKQPAGREYTSFANNSYISLGNKAYVNKIHLVQVPVELQYQLGKQSKWHLLMGTNLGYLITSNLLVYETNGTSPIYVKGNHLYNRIQLMGHIGTAIQLKQASALTLGMRVQYGITSLTKKEFDPQRMIGAQVFCQIPFAKK